MARHLNHETTEERLLVSHLRLRRILGVLGIALPLVLMLWGFALSGELQGSISAYYDLRTRDVFVGTIVAIGLFLGAYRGYELRDDVAGYLACLFALGVAFFPHDAGGWQTAMHFACAVCLFLMLSIFSLILFTKTKPPKCPKWQHRILSAFHFGDIKGDLRKPEKRRRDRIYVFCGLVILTCMVLVWPCSLLFPEGSALFWLESSMLWAFGISWFVKGDWLRWLKDKEETKLRLHEIELNVKDPEASKSFYTEVLGIPLSVDEQGLKSFDSGRPGFGIDASVHFPGKVSISFLVADIDRFVNELRDKGHQVDDPHVPDDYSDLGMLAVALEDPDGYRVEIQAPTEKSPEWLREMVR